MNTFSRITKGVVIAISMVGMAYAENNSLSSASHRWAGFYVGVDAGSAFNDVQLYSQQLGFTNPSASCNTSLNYSNQFSGVQAGYMYQFSNELVSSIEANVTLNTDQTNTLGCNSPFNPNVYDRFTFRDQMQGSIKGRLGRAWRWNQNSLLPYVTAGASFANVGLTYRNEGADYYSTNTTVPGFLVGAGIEWAFKQHWSLRAEYSYIDYSTLKLTIPNIYGLIDPNGGAKVNLSSNNIALALNYWI